VMLIARIAGGDRLAMQTLFARHRTPVYRWLLRLVGNETVAEDLLSDRTPPTTRRSCFRRRTGTSSCAQP
jgi:hypothetical protein